VSLVEEGALEDLLVHPSAHVRSCAASCAAKIGLGKSPVKIEESSDGEGGSSSSDDEAEKVTPAQLKKSKSPAKKEESCG